MASGGSSISQWKLILTIKSYISKSQFKSVDDIVKKGIPSLMKYSSIKDEKKITVEQTSKELIKDNKPAISTLNSYLPIGLNFKNKEASKEVKKPDWMERKKNFVPKINIDNRTRHLLSNLGSLSVDLLLKRINDLSSHLQQYPATIGTAVKCSGISNILKICEISNNELVKQRSREVLALLGYVAPVKCHGIRVLSIDGGGIRGLVAISILNDLEKRAGQPIHKMFDYICGVSTGGIIAALTGSEFMPLDECMTLYRDVSTKMFSNTTVQKTARFVWNSSFYDGNEWSKVLEKHVGSKTLIETVQQEEMPKIGIIAAHSSCEVIKPYLFRNYSLPHHVASHYDGSYSAALWEAVRASAAAPGYFNEFVVEDKVLLDGGVMVNNPTSIGIHEARRLWPNSKIQTVVSIGTGKHEPLISKPDPNTSWNSRLRAIVNSATDTEVVHTTMHDLLPFGTYFRFNPYLSEMVSMDEIRQDKISTMLEDTNMYIRKNDDKIKNAVASLSRSKDFVNWTSDCYNYKKLTWKARL